MQIKNEGRGNGVKTVLSNIVDVAKALKCDAKCRTWVPLERTSLCLPCSDVRASDPLKYIGMELGVHSEINKDRYIVTGTFNAKQMQDLVDAYIRVFIICPQCKCVSSCRAHCLR